MREHVQLLIMLTSAAFAAALISALCMDMCGDSVYFWTATTFTGRLAVRNSKALENPTMPCCWLGIVAAVFLRSLMSFELLFSGNYSFPLA